MNLAPLPQEPPRLASLKGDWAFQRLRRGRSGGSRLVSVRWRPVRQEGIRVGIVTSRKVGNAVTRNRVRRRLREALRELLRRRTPAADAPAGIDLLILARPACAGASYDELRSALDRALARSAFP